MFILRSGTEAPGPEVALAIMGLTTLVLITGLLVSIPSLREFGNRDNEVSSQPSVPQTRVLIECDLGFIFNRSETTTSATVPNALA